MKSRISGHLEIYRSDLDCIAKKDKTLLDLIESGFFSGKLLDQIMEEKQFPVFHLLNDEKKVLHELVSQKLAQDHEKLRLNKLSEEYEKNLIEITDVFDDFLKQKYCYELKKLFVRSLDRDSEKNLFRTINYFIHFINWDCSFYNFYDSTYEIVPSRLKLIEIHISRELLTRIKAYMAYYTHANILKRFLEKREQGKISVLNYLDWKNTIKGMLKKQFISLFGTNKGNEYIGALDNILKEKINGGLQPGIHQTRR